MKVRHLQRICCFQPRQKPAAYYTCGRRSRREDMPENHVEIDLNANRLAPDVLRFDKSAGACGLRAPHVCQASAFPAAGPARRHRGAEADDVCGRAARLRPHLHLCHGQDQSCSAPGPSPSRLSHFPVSSKRLFSGFYFSRSFLPRSRFAMRTSALAEPSVQQQQGLPLHRACSNSSFYHW